MCRFALHAYESSNFLWGQSAQRGLLHTSCCRLNTFTVKTPQKQISPTCSICQITLPLYVPAYFLSVGGAHGRVVSPFLSPGGFTVRTESEIKKTKEEAKGGGSLKAEYTDDMS